MGGQPVLAVTLTGPRTKYWAREMTMCVTERTFCFECAYSAVNDAAVWFVQPARLQHLALVLYQQFHALNGRGSRLRDDCSRSTQSKVLSKAEMWTWFWLLTHLYKSVIPHLSSNTFSVVKQRSLNYRHLVSEAFCGSAVTVNCRCQGNGFKTPRESRDLFKFLTFCFSTFFRQYTNNIDQIAYSLYTKNTIHGRWWKSANYFHGRSSRLWDDCSRSTQSKVLSKAEMWTWFWLLTHLYKSQSLHI